MKTARLILENPNILKVGFGLDNDIAELKTHFKIDIQNVEDMSPLVTKHFKQDSPVGLQKVVAFIFNQYLDKKEQTSNWGNSRLTQSQILYAANDAYASLCIKYAICKISLKSR